MSLPIQFQSIRSDLPRYARAFAAVRDCEPAFAPYDTAADLAGALNDSAVPTRTRRALVNRVVMEAQKTSASPVWSSVLALAFSPMLNQLRTRLGRPSLEDLDSMVLVAFLDALRTVTPGHYIWLALRRATAYLVVRRCAADRQLDVSTEFDDEIHGVDVFGRDARAVERDAIFAVEAHFGSEIFDVLLATRGVGVSLKDYVATICPDRRLRARRYQQLRVARRKLERSLRARLQARAA